MKILVDMNLSPHWVSVLKDAGFEAVHWSEVGDPRATDQSLMTYAKMHAYVVFTHDLDFGSILAATQAQAPSVVQVRTQNVDPRFLGPMVISMLQQCRRHLDSGALVSLDESGGRVRMLPMHR
jgi:predicted nuclease of predicted toxin-antitoxin system